MKKEFLFLLLTTNLCFSTPIDLKIGARPQGMGGAFVAVSDDSNAIYWNPAGLAQISLCEISFMHSSPFKAKSTYIDWISFTKPVRKSSGIGIGFLYKWAKLEEGQTINKMSDSEFIIGWASSILDGVMLGGNVKYLNLSSKIDKRRGVGFDIGFLYNGNFPLKDCSIGLMGRNFFSQLQNESFPGEVRIGISKRFDERIILSSDVSIKKDVNKKEFDIRLHSGFEILVFKHIFLRGGYDNGDIALGFGIIFRNYQCDYSFLSEKEYDLPGTHRVSFGIKF